MRDLGALLLVCTLASACTTAPVRPPFVSEECIQPVGSAPSEPARSPGVTLRLPHGASGPRYESDDLALRRPKWSGTTWRVAIVLSGADITEFVQSDESCRLVVDSYERKIVMGNWISDEPGIFMVVYEPRQSKPFALVSVHGLPPSEAFAVLGSVRPALSEQ